MSRRLLYSLLLLISISPATIGCRKVTAKTAGTNAEKSKTDIKTSGRKNGVKWEAKTGIILKGEPSFEPVDVSGVIKFENGDPVENTTIAASGPSLATFATNEDGRFSLAGRSGLIPGEYELRLQVGKQEFVADVSIVKSTKSLVVTMKPEKREIP